MINEKKHSDNKTSTGNIVSRIYNSFLNLLPNFSTESEQNNQPIHNSPEKNFKKVRLKIPPEQVLHYRDPFGHSIKRSPKKLDLVGLAGDDSPPLRSALKRS